MTLPGGENLGRKPERMMLSGDQVGISKSLRGRCHEQFTARGVSSRQSGKEAALQNASEAAEGGLA